MLLITLAPLVMLPASARGQSNQTKVSQTPHSVSATAPEECDYANPSEQLRPSSSNASAEISAIDNAGSARQEDLRLPVLKDTDTSGGQERVECKKEESKDKNYSPAKPLADTTPQDVPAVPLVSYSNGILTIRAHNALFSDVLNAIRARTGAVVEFPPSVANDRVFDQIGPAPMREVLVALLQGSEFNYVMLSSPTDPRIVHRLILTAREGKPNASPALADAVPANAALSGPGLGQETAQGLEEESAPAPPAVKAVIPASLGKSLQEQALALQQANPQMTRGEILSELQKRHNEELDQQAEQEPAPPQ